MINVDILCEWENSITFDSGKHGELRIRIPTDDSEGMDGGTVTIIFERGGEALESLVREVNRIIDLINQASQDSKQETGEQ